MQREFYQTVDDFLLDPSFQRWVREGIDEDGWQLWMKQEPANLHLAREAYSLIAAMGLKSFPVSETETEAALLDTWEKISGTNNVPKKTSLSQRLRWPFAAAVALISGIGLVWQLRQQPQQVSLSEEHYAGKTITKQYNSTKEPLLITLEDGSSLLLQPGSQISYPDHFDKAERKVTLSGEAFFEISKNPSRPFLVYASETVTRVVGTSFRIKAYEHQPAVEIIVRTGQVKVSSLNQTDSDTVQEIALHPNESIKFVRNQAVFEKPVIAKPASLVPIEQLQFDFTDTPVSKIFETIELAYGLKIHYPEDLLKDCYLSTSLADEPLPQKLKIISESLGGQTHYQISEDQITIFSNGCN